METGDFVVVLKFLNDDEDEAEEDEDLSDLLFTLLIEKYIINDTATNIRLITIINFQFIYYILLIIYFIVNSKVPSEIINGFPKTVSRISCPLVTDTGKLCCIVELRIGLVNKDALYCGTTVESVELYVKIPNVLLFNAPLAFIIKAYV